VILTVYKQLETDQSF